MDTATFCKAMGLSQSSLTGNELCNFCITLVVVGPNSLTLLNTLSTCRRVDTYPDFPKLTESSKNGCPLCDVVLKSRIKELCQYMGPMTKITPRGTRVTISPDLAHLSDNLRHFVSFDVTLRGEPDIIKLRFDIYSRSGHAANPRFCKLPKSEALCTENVSLMKDWINLCDTSHSLCRMIHFRLCHLGLSMSKASLQSCFTQLQSTLEPPMRLWAILGACLERNSTSQR